MDKSPLASMNEDLDSDKTKLEASPKVLRERSQELARANRELEEKVAGLEKASRLKDEFLAMLGHELRNPLGVIANGIQLLRSDAAPEHRDWTEQMLVALSPVRSPAGEGNPDPETEQTH